MAGFARRSNLIPYAALGLLALIWGFSFVLIKAGVQTLDPSLVVLIRAASAAATLYVLVLVTSRQPARQFGRRWKGYLFMAATGVVIPFLAIAAGELSISSGLASILNATTPLWTAIAAYWVTPGERPSPLNYLGVAIGFLGAGILLAPQLLADPIHAGLVGSLLILVASASYAAAALGQRRLLPGIDPIEGAFWQMTIATVVMLPIAAPAMPQWHASLLSIAAAAVLGVFGSGIASILYFFIINRLGATGGSSVTFLVPLTAVVWGALLFREQITLVILTGMAVILLGVALTSLRGGARPAAAEAA
jgi:drug/metabolite transporter (DMT)-like permease